MNNHLILIRILIILTLILAPNLVSGSYGETQSKFGITDNGGTDICTHNNSVEKVQVQYPRGWRSVNFQVNPFSYPQIGHFVSGNNDIVIYRVTSQVNLQAFMDKIQQEIKANEPTFRLTELTSDYKIGGFPAFKFVYQTGVPSPTSTNSTHKNLVIGSIVNDRFILIYFNGVNEPKLLSDVNKMLDLIKFNEFNPNQKPELCIYDNPTLGIRFQYLPENWYVSDSTASKGLVYVNSIENPSNTYLAIHVDNNSNNNFDLANKLVSSTNEFKKTYGSNFTLLGSNTNSLLAANPGYMMLFTINSTSPFEKLLQLGTFKNNKFYSLQFTSSEMEYADSLPKIQRTIDSFEITH